MENIKENLGKLKGQVIIKNLTTGEILKTQNLVVDIGYTHMFRLLSGVTSDYFDYLAAGDGAAPVSSTDTALGNQVGSKIQVSGKLTTSTYLELITQVPGSEWVFNWKELGILSNANVLFARVNIDFVHSLGDNIEVKWRWILSS